MVPASRSPVIISIHALREEGDLQCQCVTPFPKYFYPRPPRGGRPREQRPLRSAVFISIHALREEGDLASIRACAEQERVFLSTPSARRATRASTILSNAEIISIHALREEGDHLLLCVNARYYNFYPRPPRGGRRRPQAAADCPGSISIHALREEGDRRAALHET